jgi:hypothetical protein
MMISWFVKTGEQMAKATMWLGQKIVNAAYGESAQHIVGRGANEAAKAILEGGSLEGTSGFVLYGEGPGAQPQQGNTISWLKSKAQKRSEKRVADKPTAENQGTEKQQAEKQSQEKSQERGGREM